MRVRVGLGVRVIVGVAVAVGVKVGVLVGVLVGVGVNATKLAFKTRSLLLQSPILYWEILTS